MFPLVSEEFSFRTTRIPLYGALPLAVTTDDVRDYLRTYAETFFINELRAYLGYSSWDYKLCFWRNYDGAEVDVLCETAEGFVAIEIKVSSRSVPFRS